MKSTSVWMVESVFSEGLKAASGYASTQIKLVAVSVLEQPSVEVVVNETS